MPRMWSPNRGHFGPDNLVPFLREILVPKPHRSARDDAGGYGVYVACDRCSFRVSDVSTIRATLETSAITQLMFDLCSAPCKARRFAPPAHLRGLRALTVPARRSCLGHYVMAGV